jgi:hypothetical protein
MQKEAEIAICEDEIDCCLSYIKEKGHTKEDISLMYEFGDKAAKRICVLTGWWEK